MKLEQVNDDWKGMDPDDVPGYLTDYLCGEFRSEGGQVMNEDEVAHVVENNPQKVYELLINIRNALIAEQHND